MIVSPETFAVRLIACIEKAHCRSFIPQAPHAKPELDWYSTHLRGFGQVALKGKLEAVQILTEPKIECLTSESSAEAFSLVCKVFVEASVLHTAMNISIEEYREYMASSFEVMRNQNISLIAKDTRSDKLVGCLIACDYMTQTPVLTSIPDKLKPVNAILKSLDDIYRKNRQLEEGQCLLVDMAVVTPAARGQGIYRMLREAIHQLGREAGFSHVVGELSSAATQHLCVNRFKHKIRAEIEYSSFKYRNQNPFLSIKNPSSIVLADGDL